MVRYFNLDITTSQSASCSPIRITSRYSPEHGLESAQSSVEHDKGGKERNAGKCAGDRSLSGDKDRSLKNPKLLKNNRLCI